MRKKKLVLPNVLIILFNNKSKKNNYILQYTEIQPYIILLENQCSVSLKNLFVFTCDILVNHFYHNVMFKRVNSSLITLRRSISLMQSARALASIKSNI